MKDIKETVSEKLVLLRKNHNFTQSELAEKLNYSDKAISKWENGESLPSIDVLYEITKLYGIKLDDLVSDTNIEMAVTEDCIKAEKILRRRLFYNRLTIALLAEVLVWFMAMAVYVYSYVWFDRIYWLIFLWAIPVSAIVAIVFNGIWGKRIITFILISILLWSLITALYFQFMQLNMWALFLLGIPPQAAIILWSNMKKLSKDKIIK